MLITLYKRSGIEPYHVTQCISSLLKAIVDRNPQILDGVVEQLLTALFVQVCQFSYDSSTAKGIDIYTQAFFYHTFSHEGKFENIQKPEFIENYLSF